MRLVVRKSRKALSSSPFTIYFSQAMMHESCSLTAFVITDFDLFPVCQSHTAISI